MTEPTGLTYHSAVAFVRDIELAKTFYTGVLGLAVDRCPVRADTTS